MKRQIFMSLLLLFVTLLMPLLFIPFGGTSALADEPPEEEPLKDGDDPHTESDGVLFEQTRDGDFIFTALTDGVLREYSMEDYLLGVLAAEMPASFEPEALKAQAVAARTFILNRVIHASPNHPDAAVCDDHTCCEAFINLNSMRAKWGADYAEYLEKLKDAVRGTDGQVLLFEGEPILAAFHSSSAGQTESSAAVWSDRPYLVSVSSPETDSDVPNYVSTVEVSTDDFKKTICAAYPQAEFPQDPGNWLSTPAIDAGGRVGNMSIGGVNVSGTTLRSLFSLRSTAFTLEYTGNSFLFTVTGYGHGVGMSQYGANVMAKQGATYKEILAHYYPGSELTDAMQK